MKKSIVACASAIFTLSLGFAFASSQEKEEAPNSFVLLSSPDRRTRERGFSQLTYSMATTDEFLKQKLIEPDFWKNRNAYGTSALCLGLATAMRLNSVTPHLIDHLTFSLDPRTFDKGARRRIESVLPVVGALMTIDSREVQNQLLQKLPSISDKNERLCALWVLQQTEGDMLPILLNRELKKFTIPPGEEPHESVINMRLAVAALPTLETDFVKFAKSR